ncbi:hypothetical protein B9Z55_020458 [Caenorhabditis nigoni]|uniref:Uncharacterized protein n=1 Tax=Caenorhabditis nigoni TaxID=1611254 RepID=A0A2G5TMW7_9PELO|nr:hypothetical protein B9Z55_020458 [Caenorhabditis nigoni]
MMVITSQPSTSTSCPPPTATVIPVPKPRRIVFQNAAKTPVPCPRKSLLKAKSLEGEEVRLRKSLIRRDTYQPIFMEREKLQRILEVAEPELKSPKTRPYSFPIGSSPNFEISKLELSSYDNQETVSSFFVIRLSGSKNRNNFQK